MHINSNLLFSTYAKSYFARGQRVLEIGPDQEFSVFRSLVNEPKIQWETLNLTQQNNPTHVALNEYEFGLPSNSYDIVISGQVIEHVKNIWVWIKEVARICKPGGYVITLNPASWPYHEAPLDCWRIFPEGMKALCSDAGLETQLCVCENLQLQAAGVAQNKISLHEMTSDRASLAGFRRLFLGMGETCPKWVLLLKKIMGWPTSICFDTLTIAQKK